MIEQDTTAQERTQWLDPIVVVSGGFDPVHRGHLELFKEAAKHGQVHVLLNSDEWLVRKKGAAFLPFKTRKEILINFTCVSRVHLAEDKDNTVCLSLKLLRVKYPNTKILFANGGDRKEENVPELAVCEEYKIKPLWNIGGEKLNSSSNLLSSYEHKHGIKHVTTRTWGSYEIMGEGEGWLTKILTVWPRKHISFQRHLHREERWLILEGDGEFFSAEAGRWLVKPSDQIQIPVNNTHWIANPSHDKNLIILETWLGDKLEESDIERIENELTIS
jgi:cytidyltransferase-like protein